MKDKNKVTRSITRNTLVSMAIRVSVVIVVMTTITYFHIVSVSTNQSLSQLEKYIAERGDRERQIFKLAEDNQLALKKELIARLEISPHIDPIERFTTLFTRFSDGVIRNRLDNFDGTKGSFAYIGRQAEINADIRRRVLTFFDLSNQYGPAWHHRLQNVYFTTPENILVGYWPDLPTWAHDATADLYMPDEEYVWVADKKHNPSRETVWTGLFYDVTSKAWMVSAETPVDIQGKHIATIGHDILLNELLDRSINNHLKGAYNIIIRHDGRLIAHPNNMQDIKNAAGYYDILKSNDEHLKMIYNLVKQNHGKPIIENGNYNEYLAVADITEPGWHFVTVYPKSLVTSTAFSTARIILILGAASLLLELLIVFFVFRKNVSLPLMSLMNAVNCMTRGELDVDIDQSKKDEFGLLGKSFNKMARTVAERTSSLENERNYIESILDTAGALVIVLDRNGRIIRFNKACEVTTGYDFEEVNNKFVWDILLLPEDIEPVKRVFIDITQTRLPAHHQNYWLAKDGRKILIDWSNTVNTDDKGQINSVVALGQDITEHKQTISALATSERRFESMAEISPVGIFQTNTDGKCFYANNQWCAITGLTPEEALDDGWSSALFEDDRERVIHEWNEAVSKNLKFSLEYRFKNKNNEISWVYGQAIAETDKEGNITGYVGTVTDITKHKNAEEKIALLNTELEHRVERRTRELEKSVAAVQKENEERRRVEKSLIQAKDEAEQANQLKSEFLGRMSHELRTPMNAILGFGQLLKFDPGLNEDQHNNIKEILDAGTHLLNLINEVLELSSIETGNINLVMDDFSLPDITNECVALLRHAADQRNITINNLIGPYDNLNVYVDRTRFKEIIINLLTNAVKYIEDNGSITLNCERISPEVIRVNVIDDGPGIPKDKQQVLFEPFNRLGAEFSEIEGTGIGLSISTRLIELMGGSIGVDSIFGEGSTFWVECRAGKKQTNDSMETVTSHEAKGYQNIRKVLYVEDNPANQRLVQQILRQRAYIKLIITDNAESALELARTHMPDIIIMDINLPGMDGYEALTRLRNLKETSHTPVFALSAAAMPRDVERGLLAGFQRYLTKPIQVVELIEAIDNVLTDSQHLA